MIVPEKMKKPTKGILCITGAEPTKMKMTHVCYAGASIKRLTHELWNPQNLDVGNSPVSLVSLDG